MEQLLITKFYIPPTRSELVPRPRLLEQLNAGAHPGCKLTLISAPAGFGKTTLLSEWVAGSEHPVAWLSLDTGDNDPTRFLTYFIGALNRVEGIEATIGGRALGILQSPQQPPSEIVLTSLINEVAAVPFRIILVLDDYHIIESSPVDDVLTFLLEYLPPHIHLVIATREDPHLPLAHLRAKGQLTEIRAANLRFSSAEAAEFLNQVMGLGLSAKDIAALENRTEGWIAGLQLAAISMQGRDDATNFIKSFTGSHRLVLDYLIEEVLDQQSQNVQNFMLQTAILERLNGSLCDALTDQKNGQATLEMLERANLFIIPLDGERQWYRYHHLFADLLRQRLDQTYLEQIPTLHSQASEWYERNGRASDAIRHALVAEDFERAADLAELAWPAMSGSFQSIAWLGWLKALPNELVRARPVLSVAYAWANLNAGKLEAAETRLLDAEQWVEPTADINRQIETPSVEMVVVDEEQFRSLPISLAAARAYHAQAVGDVSGTMKYAQRVLDFLPEGDHQWRESATMLLGLAYWTSGDIEAAHRIFSEGLAGAPPLDTITGTFVLADMKMTLGHLHEAARTCEYGLKLAKEYDKPNPMGTEDVYSGISHIHREQGYLETAAQDLQTSKKLGEQVELPDWQYRWSIALARLKESQGNLDGALDLLDEAERQYVRTPLPVVRPIAAMKTRVWVRQGRLAKALSWAREQNLSVDDDLSYLREFEHITLARVLIAKNRVDDSIHDAIRLLNRLLKAGEEGGRTGSVIEILVQQALAYEAQDDTTSALVSLEHALRLAEPEGYFRIFVDEGPPMAKLLNEVAKRGIHSDYSRKLLAAFERKMAVNTTQQSQQLIESLSTRELEVLQLVAQGLSNREIGERLFLALDTVKGYNRKLYGKLGVKNRTQAINKAISLKILPPQ